MVLSGVFVLGANCERWCPFGGVEAIYTYVAEGNMLCSLGVSNFFILGGVLTATLLVRRAFCGYMCPIGTISEWIRVAARWLRVPGLAISTARGSNVEPVEIRDAVGSACADLSGRRVDFPQL